MEPFPTIDNLSGVWPPPPTSAADDHRERLRSMLAGYASVAGLARWVVMIQVPIIVMQTVAVMMQVQHPSAGFVGGDVIAALAAIPAIFDTILVLIWNYRLYKNTFALGATSLSYKPGFVAVSQLIPFVCFFTPYLALRQVWQATALEREMAASEGNAHRVHVTMLLNIWWGFNVLAMLAAGAFILSGSYDGPDQSLKLIMRTFSIVSSILGIFVIKALTRRQDVRYAEAAALG
ncbi:MAG: hypothetical protein JWQ02_304 [Capsulimonas sp.]|nr:hypothetical protein [Capsulimonas sp.]